MERTQTYHGAAAGLILLILIISGCEREPATDHASVTAGKGSSYQTNVIQLDSLIFTNPVRINGNVRFDLVGTPPRINAGDLVYYPAGNGVFGRVVSAATIGTRMVFQLEKSALNQIFSSISIQDTSSHDIMKSRTRIGSGSWNSDTLGLVGMFLYDDFWLTKKLQVQFASGKLNSSSSFGQFLLSGQGTDPWFDRCRLDFGYSLDLEAEMVIKSGSAVDASDSLLIESTVYGPGLVNGFPINYHVDTWLGFHVVTDKDTVLSIRLSGSNKGGLSLHYNYWESWKLDRSPLIQSSEIEHFTGPRLSGYRAEVFVHQVITPYFCGEPSISLGSRFIASAGSDVTVPDWESFQSVKTSGMMLRSGQVFGDYVPERMATTETLLYSESQSGVLENQAPQAGFTINPPAGFTDTNFEFNASASSDLESPAGSLMMRWDFDGDSHYDTEFSAEKIAFKRFVQPGVYKPILEVRDPQGLTSRKVSSVEVSLSSSAPIAFFTVTPESGHTTTFFLFDASGCYDAEDGITLLKVRWDFDGDDVFEQSWTTVKAASYVYPDPGKYTVTLEVLDTQGLRGSTTRIVNVSPPNIKPTAFFTVDPENGSIDTQFNFDASGSTDPEDPPESLRVRWDWENDGTYDTEYRTIKTIQHSFPVTGTYTVMMEVIDTEGYGTTFAMEIKVANPNTPPDADFSISPSLGQVNVPVTFDASLCVDAEDSLDQMEVRWDWNNDNIYDTDFTPVKVVRHTFTEPGTYSIKLLVRDSGGLTDTRVRMLVIE